ncbi:hypothetical protein ELUMI_v1c02040 [Williamsoniiplasma luminosum]|uniref:Lipoprotein n=1 Tax=Williamsoniiplasma luminosum TaxID=214888 RepID=A0A2K8NT05_9MOLU|nr:lipoprotein [Williamsoniiplasma luminosum]ATZ16929.1 hypothetical protein ELUMI_v1c02040 [Williamsoniiplasma luminosum]
MKKILTLLGSIGIVGAAATTVVSCENHDHHDNGDRQAEINNQLNNLKDIDTVIPESNRDLGVLEDIGMNTIKDAFRDNNQNLNLNNDNFQISQISNESAMLHSFKGYKGHITVTYKVFKNLFSDNGQNLGALPNAKEETIRKAILEKNSKIRELNPNFVVFQINKVKDNKYQALIKGEQKHSKSTIVEFTIPQTQNA